LAACVPNPPIDLEIITGYGPKAVPYLDPGSDYWPMYPGLLAQDFARFVALAQSGRPDPLEQLIAPSDLTTLPTNQADALRAQQRRHFEQSVTHARDVLRLGERRM